MQETKKTSERTFARCNHICLPFDCEQQYSICVADPDRYREFLAAQFEKYPELFPPAFSEGYEFHSRYYQKKQDLPVRRILLSHGKPVVTGGGRALARALEI